MQFAKKDSGTNFIRKIMTKSNTNETLVKSVFGIG